jgi:uncharacterized protein YjbI with pentapeptide repeats
VLTGLGAELVRFEGSLLVEALLMGARLPGVVFADCDLTGADVTGATLAGSRLHGSHLDGVRGVRSLAGALVDADQVLALAPLLLAEAGIVVSP